MQILLLLSTLVIVSLAAEVDHSAEHKKRGAPKQPAVNSLPSNGHQKPDTLNYANYQSTNTATQPPLYPLAPQNYQQVEQSQPPQQQHQQAFGFLPTQTQLLPLQYQYQQMTAMPKYQLIAAKQPNGQMQLMIIPQGLFFNAQNFGQSSYVQPDQSLFANHPQLGLTAGQTTTSPHLSVTNQNNYVTPDPSSYSTQPSSIASSSLPQANYYSQPQASLGFNQHQLLAQPSTMFLYNQPAPQLYNNYLNQPSNSLLYSQAGQQLLNYYQTNPQAKYQLLYGNNQPNHAQSTYQSPPVSSLEYEKSVSGPVSQSLTSQKSISDVGLNTNEYISQPDTHFRPIPSYGSRGPSSNYKS